MPKYLLRFEPLESRLLLSRIGIIDGSIATADSQAAPAVSSIEPQELPVTAVTENRAEEIVSRVVIEPIAPPPVEERLSPQESTVDEKAEIPSVLPKVTERPIYETPITESPIVEQQIVETADILPAEDKEVDVVAKTAVESIAVREVQSITETDEAEIVTSISDTRSLETTVTVKPIVSSSREVK